MSSKRLTLQGQSSARKARAGIITQELSSVERKKDAKIQGPGDKFADELNRSSDDEENILGGR